MNTQAMVDSAMLRTSRIGLTDYWNDSCAIEELRYAIERGAVGGTTNPPIVLEVLGKERSYWVPRVRDMAAANPTWSEVDLTWALVEAMAIRGAAELAPIHARTGGRKGWQSVQTNPQNYRNVERMVDQAVHFAGLAPNMQVKIPATAAGIVAIEEATARGVNVNATVSFTVAQALAVGQALERGLDRFEGAGGDPARLVPVVTLMVGRLDDWMKAIVERDQLAIDPRVLDWAGIAAFKRAYELFRDRHYRGRLLVAAFRHVLHWTEFVGGDLVLTMPHAWQLRYNASGIDPVARIDVPVEPAIVDELSRRIPDFQRAYEPGALPPSEFDSYGATVRTLRQFIGAYHDLTSRVRDIVLPNPDIAAA